MSCLGNIFTMQTLHSRAGHSSTLGLLPDMLMPYPPPLHPPPAGLIQAGLNAMGGPESLRRNLHNQINPVGGGGFKDPAQVCSFVYFIFTFINSFTFTFTLFNFFTTRDGAKWHEDFNRNSLYSVTFSWRH